MRPNAEFVGPLDRASQVWCDEVFEADCVAALTESAQLIVERRQAAIAGYHRTAAALLLVGDFRTARAIAFGAVAESRALTAFSAICPMDGVGSEWRRFAG